MKNKCCVNVNVYFEIVCVCVRVRVRPYPPFPLTPTGWLLYLMCSFLMQHMAVGYSGDTLSAFNTAVLTDKDKIVKYIGPMH